MYRMSDGRKRLSGYQYKKRKLEKEAELQKQAGALDSFLIRNSQCRSSETLDNSEAEVTQQLPLSEAFDSSVASTSASTTQTNGSLSSTASSSTSTPSNPVKMLSSDPATWPHSVRDQERIFLVKAGPPGPLCDYDFPCDDSGRRFTSKNYKRSLNNGELVLRHWLVYSETKNVIFCFCCKIFNMGASNLSKDGYNNWKHVGDVLKSHETSKNHLESNKSWFELSQRLKLSQTIDTEAQRLTNSEINHWNSVLMRIVSIIKMLGESCLAFQGKSDKLYKHNNGNFLKLIQLFAEFDPVMEEHVRRILRKKVSSATYLSKTIQNELISLISEKIKCHIIEDAKRSKYYSIILDCTPDASKIEQMTMIIRYVLINQTHYNSKTEVIIKESFLGFVPIEKSTGLKLTEVLLTELDKLGLPLQNMRGQGYDNGSNMKGSRAGVQARIRNLNPRAFYVPCSSHSLNLVVNDMAKSSLEVGNFFNIVQKIYVFFVPPLRWSILLKHIDGLTLKPLSDTRWESRIDAIKPLRYQIGNVYDALLSIYEDPDMDVCARDEASGLLNHIKQFKFLCSIVIWYNILNRINPVSKLMQSNDFDLGSVMHLLKTTNDFFQNSRSDEYFNQVLVDAKELANEVDIEASFSTAPRHRVRSKKRHFDYENRDEPIVDPREKYKIDFFFHVIDTAINSLDLRFTQISEHSNHFAFLYDIYGLRDMCKEELIAHCKDLEVVLTDQESSDINGLDLADELSVVCTLLPKKQAPQEVLKFITELNFGHNINIALRILLTLPVTVASGERSFSKLKIIKTYLRSTMTQERLSGLAMLGIEYDLCGKLDLKHIIKDFAELKVRKKAF